MEIIFHSHANKTHFHKKGCAPSLILKVRGFGTRKEPILLKIYSDCSQKPFESGFDDLKRPRPAFKALILAEHRTPNGSWFQYFITLLLKKASADLKE